jgi:hypothetical protein
MRYKIEKVMEDKNGEIEIPSTAIIILTQTMVSVDEKHEINDRKLQITYLMPAKT